MTRLILAATTFTLLAVLLSRCRHARCLSAHDDRAIDRWVFMGCQPCDPRCDELQDWATLYQRDCA